MPKGRSYVPTTGHDGIWFQHRGLPDPGPLQRDTATSTGLMLTSPYKAHTAYYPPDPPQPYQQKDSRNFKNTNFFSAHDNRHSFQDHGVYFGDGNHSRTLGRNILEADLRQHSTNKDHLKHYGRKVVDYDYNTIYHKSYYGNPECEEPTHRRFPKIHKDGDPSLAKLSTKTTAWFLEPEIPYKTPMHVLAISQEPLLPANAWKYSNHGKSNCYPPYESKKEPYSNWVPSGIPKSQGVIRKVGHVDI